MRKLWLISYIGYIVKKTCCPSNARDVLVHGDLSLNHLLFDQNQMVCSVLDFGDSHVGDFQEDFLYLLDEEDEEEFGADFGREVLANYKSISSCSLQGEF